MVEVASVTQRCLGIVEILRRIVRYTTADNTIRTAAVLSRTSKLFHDAAQEIVWEELDDLRNLFRCFPEDVWDDDGASSRAFIRPPTPLEWKRVLANAALVKSLTLDSDDCGPERPDWSILALHCPEKQLFPNLRELSWTDNDDRKALSHGHLFLGPKLHSLTLKIGVVAHHDSAVQRLTSLLQTVAYQRPPLRELCVAFKSDKAAVRDAVIDVVKSTELEMLACGLLLSKKEVLAIAKSSSIKKVNICCRPNLDIDDEVFHGVIFPSVSSLSLTVESLEDPSIRRLILDTSSPYLASIAITCAMDPREDTLVEFLQGLAKRPDVYNIRELHLAFAEDVHRYFAPPSEVSEHTLGARTFQMIAALRSLIALSVKSRSLDIDNDVFETVVVNLPHLHSLILLPNRYSGVVPKLTLFAVYRAAMHLPCLRELGLALDTTLSYQLGPLPGQWYNQSCTKLYVADSPLQETHVESVAVTLSMLFWNPNLQIIAGELGVPADEEHAAARKRYQAAWARCQRLLFPLSQARYQERFRSGNPRAAWAVSYTVPLHWRPSESSPGAIAPLIAIVAPVTHL